MQVKLRSLDPVPEPARLVHEQLTEMASRLAGLDEAVRSALNELLPQQFTGRTVRDDAEVIAISDYVDRTLPDVISTLERLAEGEEA